MRFPKVLLWILLLAALIGMMVCGGMTVSAVGALEWGRVVFYGAGTILCIELLVIFWMKVRN